MVQKTALAAPCGIYCGECESLGSKCQSCGQIQGKPFWTKLYSVEVCPLYDCCVNKKHLEHCGLCPELPCQTFISLRDPALSDEEAAKALQKRQKDLKLRKKIGTENWLKNKQ
jgi:hypothetical protein